MATKLMTTRTHTSTFPTSPEAVSSYSEDNDQRGVVGNDNKGWCSERVPLSSYLTRRHVAASALMPFSSGRVLPSKWDDAERWISSPVSVSSLGNNGSVYYTPGVANGKHSQYLAQHHHNQFLRRAKSKSGPLGQTGLTSYGSFNTYSPVLGMGVINGGKWRNSMTIESPGFAQARAQTRLDDGLTAYGSEAEGGRRSCPGYGGPDEWLDPWSGPLSPSYKEDTGDENIESANHDNYNGEAEIDRAISRRDMATQMFQESESSTPSSVASSRRSTISTGSPRPESNRNIDHQSPEFEVRDVQVDKQTSTTKRPNLDRHEMNDKPFNSTNFGADTKSPKLQREEDRIKAWENLQKAKAEAAIQKLEMKLEKKRSSSMEKIVEKLRRAEIKAQKMRSSLSRSNDHIQSHAVSKTTSKLPSFGRKLRLSSSTKNCSTCYPF